MAAGSIHNYCIYASRGLLSSSASYIAVNGNITSNLLSCLGNCEMQLQAFPPFCANLLVPPMETSMSIYPCKIPHAPRIVKYCILISALYTPSSVRHFHQESRVKLLDRPLKIAKVPAALILLQINLQIFILVTCTGFTLRGTAQTSSVILPLRRRTSS